MLGNSAPRSLAVAGGLTLIALLAWPVRCPAQPRLRLDQLTVKGTHNSYECSLNCNLVYCHNDCPLMHHHPAAQVDQFGVYAVELDFSIESEAGRYRAIVGHDGHCGEGCWTDDNWGKYLEAYFDMLKNTQAFWFRPLIIYLEKKCCWGSDTYDDPAVWMPFVENLAVNSFGADHIYTHSRWLNNDHGVWPSVPDLSGKVVLMGLADHAQCDCSESYGGNGIMFPGNVLPDTGTGDCQSLTEYRAMVRSGPKVVRSDYYQYEWTFDDAFAPPNPLCVEAGAPSAWLVSNLEDPYCGSSCVVTGRSGDPLCSWVCGDGWDCDPETFQVGQHGTFRFPYGTVNQAVQVAQTRGIGWTILIGAGSYPEAVQINTPMILQSSGGTAVIGR